MRVRLTRRATQRHARARWPRGCPRMGCCPLAQLVVEKMLAAEGLARQDLGREAFEARVWEWKARYGGFITQQLRQLGASCDWSRERFTLDAQLSGASYRACQIWPLVVGKPCL